MPKARPGTEFDHQRLTMLSRPDWRVSSGTVWPADVIAVLQPMSMSSQPMTFAGRRVTRYAPIPVYGRKNTTLPRAPRLMKVRRPATTLANRTPLAHIDSGRTAGVTGVIT
jgi:hypothetical protein